MKKLISNYCRVILCVCVAVCISGCMSQGAGETKAEIERRHDRVIKTGKHEIQDDLDAYLLLDRPTRLTDKFVR